MYITEHSVKNFRNLENASILPDKGINIIFGENGQGKTNLMESIWLFTGCHSFRTRKNNQLIREGQDISILDVSFNAFNRPQTASIELTDKKTVWLNEVKKDTPRRLIGEFPAVLFSPNTLSVVQDGPAERRKLIDIAISLIKPNYAAALSRYIKTLSQRNALLRQYAGKKVDDILFLPWEQELATVGARILKYRFEYIEMIKFEACESYSRLTAGREKMSLKYDTFYKDNSFIENKAAEQLFDALQKNRDNDIKRQFTSVGPHKDDLQLFVNGRNARIYGSQGQQRSCALCLKMGEAAVIEKITGESPVILLDDVMSELDEGRQELLLESLENRQVFITCCDPSQLLRLKKGKAFEVIEGMVSEI